MKRFAAAILVVGALVQGVTWAADPPPATDKPAAKAGTKPSAAGTPAAREKRALDRLQLDPTAITGNRELPKVMSIVPWKGAEPPGGPDRPMGSLVEEVLSPLDRDEFRREITYYRDLTSQSAPVVAPGATQP
jgi:hypothetical protein